MIRGYIALWGTVATSSFVPPGTGGGQSDYKITLRLTRNFPGETFKRNRTGLIWALSYLGAELAKGSFEKTITQKDSTLFELDLSQAGFSQSALFAFSKLLESFKGSEECQIKQGIAVGEFIVYTLGSSWCYYQITATANTLAEYRRRYDYTRSQQFTVTKSELVTRQRLVEMPAGNDVEKMSFIASEGYGNIEDNTFKKEAYEVFDIMPNRQLRFSIYKAAGQLIGAGPKSLSHSGKQNKCISYHEINAQPLFHKNEAINGYRSPASFTVLVEQKMNALTEYRDSLNGEVNFKNKQDHALIEQPYISYMQPSRFKLANAWNINKGRLKWQVKNMRTHQHREYPFMGALHERQFSKRFSPHKTVMLPDSIWEPNGAEPNLFAN